MFLYFYVVLPIKYPATEPSPSFVARALYTLDIAFAIYLSILISFNYTMAVLIPPGGVTQTDAERWAALEEDLVRAGVDLDSPSGSHAADQGNKSRTHWRESVISESAGAVNLDLVLGEGVTDELLPDTRNRISAAFAPRPGILGRLEGHLQRWMYPPHGPTECPSYVKIGASTKPLTSPLDDCMGMGLTVGDVSVRSLKGMKYCRKCRLPKPARAHHCSVCNKCVLKMDHHVRSELWAGSSYPDMRF